MNTKQQLVTGILAVVIVGSIAMMPVNADVKSPQASMPAPATKMVASLNIEELPQDQVKDLTYN